jgi:hypothetical protein
MIARTSMDVQSALLVSRKRLAIPAELRVTRQVADNVMEHFLSD